MHHQILLLPGVTALQQCSDGLPEFTYKPLLRENGHTALSAGQEQHRRLENQRPESAAQSIHTGSVHQRSLWVRPGHGSHTLSCVMDTNNTLQQGVRGKGGYFCVSWEINWNIFGVAQLIEKKEIMVWLQKYTEYIYSIYIKSAMTSHNVALQSAWTGVSWQQGGISTKHT